MTSAGCLGIGEFTFDIITLVAKTRDSVLPDYLTTKTRNITKNDYVLSCHVQIALKIAVIDYQKTIIFEMMFLQRTMHTVPGEWIKITKYSTTEENPRTHLEQTSAISEHVNFIVIQVKNDEKTDKKKPA